MRRGQESNFEEESRGGGNSNGKREEKERKSRSVDEGRSEMQRSGS